MATLQQLKNFNDTIELQTIYKSSLEASVSFYFGESLTLINNLDSCADEIIWDIKGYNCKVILINNKKLNFINSKGNLIEFSEGSTNKFLYNTRTDVPKNFRVSLETFSNCDFNSDFEFVSKSFLCDKGYILKLKKDMKTKYELPYSSKKTHLVNHDHLKIYCLLPKILLINAKYFNHESVSKISGKTWNQQLQDNRNELIDAFISNFTTYGGTFRYHNFVDLINHKKYGLCVMVKYNRPFSQVAKELFGEYPKFEEINELIRYFKNCDKLSRNHNVATFGDTYTKYQKYDHARKYIPCVKQAIKIMNQKKVEKARLIKQEAKKQMDISTTLEKIHKSIINCEIFSEIFMLTESEFNEKHSSKLTETGKLLANSLYQMDKQTREFLLLTHDIYI